LQLSANVHTRFASALYNEATKEFIATTLQSRICAFSAPDNIRTVLPHLARATSLELAANGKTIAAYGSDEFLELWNAETLSREHVTNTNHGAISRVAFINHSNQLATAGRDGRLVYRDATGSPTRMISLGRPISDFVPIPNIDAAVVSTTDGSVWRVNEHDQITNIGGSGSQVIRLLSVPGTALIAIGYANGRLVFINTTTWKQSLMLQASQAIRDIAFTPDGRVIALVDNDDIVHIAHRTGATWFADRITWTTFTARARTLAFAPDGLLVLLCSDGNIWIYSPAHTRWLCIPTGTADLSILAFSSDNEAVVFDSDGRILSLDLQLAQRLLASKTDLAPLDSLQKDKQ